MLDVLLYAQLIHIRKSCVCTGLVSIIVIVVYVGPLNLQEVGP